jgi:hypothetical protein
MRSSSDKSARRRTVPLAAPLATTDDVGTFHLAWRDRRGRQRRQSFATSGEMLTALDGLRRRGDIAIRGADRKRRVA